LTFLIGSSSASIGKNLNGDETKTTMIALLSLIVGGCGLGLSGCATTRPTGTHQTQLEQEALFTVESIDVPNRPVTVRNTSGLASTYYVDESITTFPQANVGDRVWVRFQESFALRLKEPGEAGSAVEVTEESSPPAPGRPAARTSGEVKATVRIRSVNRDGSVVTFIGPRGRRTVQIRDPAMQDYVKELRAGDHVEVTYKEALALSLEPV